jgi:DNA-directed RNA polymerase specialized sigma24 family protein
VERPANSPLLNRHGQPLSEPIEHALRGLVPRLRRHFPTLNDFDLTQVLEEAGQRIADREDRDGPLRRLRGYAWKTLHSVAISKLRGPEMRIELARLGPEQSRAVVDSLPSQLASPEAIERDILLREVLALLSPEQQLICVLKTAGFSSREIAARLGRSVAGVNVSFWRATRKIRKASVSLPRRADDSSREGRRGRSRQHDRSPGQSDE